MFRRELIKCRTDTVPLVLGLPSGLKLLIQDGVVLGMPSGDEYCARRDDGNVVRDMGLLGALVIRATGLRWKIAAFYEPELDEIRTVLGRLFPCVSTDCGP